MRCRRADDPELRLVMARPTGWIRDGELSVGPESPGGGELHAVAEGDEVVLLLQLDGEGVLVTGEARLRLPILRDPGALVDQVHRAAAAGRQARVRAERRLRLPDQLIAYFEALSAAQSEEEVFRALAEHALRIVGGHLAFALRRDAAHGIVRGDAAGGAAPSLCVPWWEELASPGLVLSLDARPGGRAAAAAPLFADPATEMVAHVPIGERGEMGVLILTERREERIFEPEDWDMLRALALQAEMSVRRVRLIESVRTLSLTDPLTGLANRRHMDVVLEHVWAAALRGDSLALMALDLDDFKMVNDCQGHLAGDALLRAVADALRSEARGADTVVRYGGDEFLVILPGGSAEGACLLAERVRARLAGRVELSAGVAEYDPEIPSPAALIREADRRLYEAKRRKKRALGNSA